MDDIDVPSFLATPGTQAEGGGHAASAAGPLAGAATPLSLIKGGETKYKGGITVDFLRFTVWGESLIRWRAEFKDQDPQPVRGKADGFYRAERYASGWVRRFDPVSDMNNGVGKFYESWEFPGGVPPHELERVRRHFNPERSPQVRPSCIDLAWDVVGQGYPRPDFFRESYKLLGARSKGDKPYRYIESQIGQTCEIGSPSSDLHFTIYEKGKKYRSEGLEVPEDWVRVEARCKGGIFHQLAWVYVVHGRRYDFFSGLCTHYFTGELARNLFPDGLLAEGEVLKKRPDALRKMLTLIKQWGPMLTRLRDMGLLDEIVGMVPDPSRASEYRMKAMQKEIEEVGMLEFLNMLSSVLGSGDEPFGVPV